MDKLDGSLQENILVLLCFHDDHARYIRNLVELEHFDPLYKEIAYKAYAFIDEFKCAPKEHIADEFSKELSREGTHGSSLARVLEQLYEARDTVNVEYTLSNIEHFIKKQKLSAEIIRAMNELNFDSKESYAVAEGVLRGALRERPELLIPTLEFDDVGAVLSYIAGVKDPTFLTGIKSLDYHGIGPARKGLHLFVALFGRGKSWYMINLGKQALRQRQNVFHLSLEMRADEVLARYYQTFFGISKHRTKKEISIINTDTYGNYIGIDNAIANPKIAFEDFDHATKIRQRMATFGKRFKRLRVLQLSQPSTQQVEAYLDQLEAASGFKPDLLIVDYADLMKIGSTASRQESSNYRIALGEVYKDLRSMAMERNMAVVTASQANRDSESKRIIKGDGVAEDFSKVATADTVLTYNQTDAEKLRNLARLYVAKSRQSEDKFTVLIAQNYDMGQFVLSSAKLTDFERYKSDLKYDGN